MSTIKIRLKSGREVSIKNNLNLQDTMDEIKEEEENDTYFVCASDDETLFINKQEIEYIQVLSTDTYNENKTQTPMPTID